MLQEFKEFAMKGNVMDLAVAVIIGGAFGKIVTSLVDDLLMPVLGLLLGRINLSGFKYVIAPAGGDMAESALMYGSFVQSLIDFLIISFSIFLLVKLLSSFKKKKEVEEPPPAEEPSREEVLLTEIRDLLKDR
ncbi:MAG: large-conductance mechanosensitive channel protein MscL [Firmicutes bacterium]|nr:large-conductance mechanosensitive channel protein MscL [Bacillota bacterium]